MKSAGSGSLEFRRGLRWRTWGALGAGIAGLAWLIDPGSPPAWLAVSAAGAVLAAIAPVWAVVLIAFTAPFELPFKFYGTTVYTTEWLLALTLPGFFWNLWRRRAWRRAGAPVALMIAPLLAVVIISAALVHAPQAGKGVLRWLEFLGVLFLATHVLRRGREAEAMIWALVLAAAVSAVQGLLQTAAGPSVHPELSALFLGGRNVTRAGAGYGANTLAMLLALLLPFTAAAFWSHPRVGVRRAALPLAGLLLAGLIATFSLTGGVALLTVAAVAGIVAVRRGYIPVWIPSTLLLAAAGAALGATWGLKLWTGDVWATKLASFHDRLDYLRVVGRMFQSAPWFGVGPGLYRFLAPAWGPGVNPIGLVTHPHSLYLSVLAELGFFGLTALVWALVRAGVFLAAHARRLPAGWPSAGAWALLAGLAGFAVANLVEHGLIHDRGVHAALVLGAALVWVRRPSRPRRPERRRVFELAWQTDAPPADRAAVLQLLAQRQQERAPLYAFLARVLDGGKPARVLEFGCGPALDALHLAGRSEWEVHGLDFSSQALQRAESAAALLARPLSLHQADVRRTGLAAESFDVIFSQGLLEHFPDPAPVWREIARLLKPGGWAVVDVPQTLNPYTLAKLWHRWRGDWPWGWETQYTPGRLRAEGRACGLHAVAARGYGYRGGLLDATAWLRTALRPGAPRAWDAWERSTGAWWMMNVVMLFKKDRTDPSDPTDQSDLRKAL